MIFSLDTLLNKRVYFTNNSNVISFSSSENSGTLRKCTANIEHNINEQRDCFFTLNGFRYETSDLQTVNKYRNSIDLVGNPTFTPEEITFSLYRLFINNEELKRNYEINYDGLTITLVAKKEGSKYDIVINTNDIRFNVNIVLANSKYVADNYNEIGVQILLLKTLEDFIYPSVSNFEETQIATLYSDWFKDSVEIELSNQLKLNESLNLLTNPFIVKQISLNRYRFKYSDYYFNLIQSESISPYFYTFPAKVEGDYNDYINDTSYNPVKVLNQTKYKLDLEDRFYSLFLLKYIPTIEPQNLWLKVQQIYSDNSVVVSRFIKQSNLFRSFALSDSNKIKDLVNIFNDKELKFIKINYEVGTQYTSNQDVLIERLLGYATTTPSIYFNDEFNNCFILQGNFESRINNYISTYPSFKILYNGNYYTVNNVEFTTITISSFNLPLTVLSINETILTDDADAEFDLMYESDILYSDVTEELDIALTLKSERVDRYWIVYQGLNGSLNEFEITLKRNDLKEFTSAYKAESMLQSKEFSVGSNSNLKYSASSIYLTKFDFDFILNNLVIGNVLLRDKDDVLLDVVIESLTVETELEGMNKYKINLELNSKISTIYYE